MKTLNFALALGFLYVQSSWADDLAKPFSCKYNDDDGEPVSLFKRVASNANDWYSRYQAIQFCERAEGKGTYVLVEEQLIKNMNVLNPARAVLSAERDSEKVTAYAIKDSFDHLELKVTADGKRMLAVGTWVGDIYLAKLQLVWSRDEKGSESK